jgi:hypothetical protein
MEKKEPVMEHPPESEVENKLVRYRIFKNAKGEPVRDKSGAEVKVPIYRKQWLKEKAAIEYYRDCKKRGCR